MRLRLFYLLGLTLLTCGSFAPVWQNDFVSYDDPLYVTKNPARPLRH